MPVIGLGKSENDRQRTNQSGEGFLGWSQAHLASESGLSINAIRYWEAGHGWPISMRSARSGGPLRIELAFNRYGLKLTYDPPCGP